MLLYVWKKTVLCEAFGNSCSGKPGVGWAGGELSVARVSEIILPSSEKGRARWAATLIVLQPGIARPGLFCSPVIHLLWGKGTKAWNVLTQIFVSSLSHEKCLLFCTIILVREMRGSLLLSALRKDKLSVGVVIISSDLNSKKEASHPPPFGKYDFQESRFHLRVTMM